MKTFDTVNEYLDALSKEPDLAVVSVMMASKSRGVTRAAIERMLQAKKLTSVKIEDVQCILAKDLIDLQVSEKAKVKTVRNALEDYAQRGVRVVFYQDVMDPIGLSTGIPAHRAMIGGILGEISAQTYEEHGVLLSVLVHKKTRGQTLPSQGFFNLVESLDIQVADPVKFVESATNDVLRAYL